MHPAHIPFIREIQTAIFYITSDLWPCSRFLSDHDNALVASTDQGIDMTEKLYRLKIFIATKLIWHPLPRFLAIIQIKHRCDRIYTQTIDVILLDPHKGTADQKVLDLILAIIKDLGTPLRMLALSRIRILIQGLTVEICQSMRILWKMRRNPV